MADMRTPGWPCGSFGLMAILLILFSSPVNAAQPCLLALMSQDNISDSPSDSQKLIDTALGNLIEGNPFNQDGLKPLFMGNTLTPDQVSALYSLLRDYYNINLKKSFPRDAFKGLIALSYLGENIPPKAELNLDNEWLRLLKVFNLDSGTKVSTQTAYRWMRKRNINEAQLIQQTTAELSDFIGECIRRAHLEKTPRLLYRAIEAFKLLGYLRVGTEHCPACYNDFTEMGVDEKSLHFRYLRKSEVTENQTYSAVPPNN